MSQRSSLLSASHMAEGCMREPEAEAFTQTGRERKKNIVCSIKVCINNSLQFLSREFHHGSEIYPPVVKMIEKGIFLLHFSTWHLAVYTKKHLRSSGRKFHPPSVEMLKLPKYSCGANQKNVFVICMCRLPTS